MTATEKLHDLASLVPCSLAAHVAVCEYSAEDSTPSLHIDLWRGHDLHELPEAVASLTVVSEGHWDGGRSYSLQLAQPPAYVPCPTFKGLLRHFVYSADKMFASGEDAFEIRIFGRLPLKEGVTLLQEPLKISRNCGGNNESRTQTIPAGALVYYCPTKGQCANLLWSSVWPE